MKSNYRMIIIVSSLIIMIGSTTVLPHLYDGTKVYASTQNGIEMSDNDDAPSTIPNENPWAAGVTMLL